MNLNNIFKKVSGVALAVTLSFSVFSKAFAAEAQQTPFTSAPSAITKTLTVDDGVYQPAEIFNFAIKGTTDGPQKANITAAPDGFVTLNANSVTFDGSAKGTGSKTIGLSYNTDALSQPGIYRVAISESIPEETNRRDGLTYDDAVRYMDLYVTRNSQTNTLEISNTVVYNEKGEKVPGTGQAAGNQAINFNNEYNTVSLTVKKQVAGNMGDLDQAFDFTITIKGTENEKYTYNDKEAKSGESFTVSLKHGQSVVINGLTAKDTITVDEDDKYADQGYTAEGEITAAEEVGSVNKEVEVTNTRDQITPTGLIENIAPFVLAIAAAGVIFFVYFKKDKNEEEQYA